MSSYMICESDLHRGAIAWLHSEHGWFHWPAIGWEYGHAALEFILFIIKEVLEHTNLREIIRHPWA